MKPISTIFMLTVALLGTCGSLRAVTAAYWCFEGGSAGMEYDGDQDISGNGNHLSSDSALAPGGFPRVD